MTSKLTKQTNLTFRLTESEKFIIRKLAAEEIISPGKLVRQIIKRWFAENGIEDPLRWIADNGLAGQYREENGNQGHLPDK